MTMPSNWLEWLGVIGSVTTIIAFALYLAERSNRKNHDTLMVGFLHAAKALVESMSVLPTTTGANWQPLLPQINDMLARLQSPARKSCKVVCTIAMLVTVVTLATGAYFVFAYSPLGIVFDQNPGRFDRKNLVGLVEQVRIMRLMPGEAREFKVETLSAPKSIRPVKSWEAPSRGQGAGHVWAEVSRDGNLSVVIETRDLGHAGEYGFAYSDAPLSPKPLESGVDWLTIDVPGPLNLVQPGMKIDEHWWKVEYNLD